MQFGEPGILRREVWSALPLFKPFPDIRLTIMLLYKFSARARPFIDHINISYHQRRTKYASCPLHQTLLPCSASEVTLGFKITLQNATSTTHPTSLIYTQSTASTMKLFQSLKLFFQNPKLYQPASLLLCISAVVLLCMIPDWVGPRDFRISFFRYDIPNCADTVSLEKDQWYGARMSNSSGCQNWDDGLPFTSFNYQWLRGYGFQNIPKDAWCALLVYEKEHCEGHLLWFRDHVRDDADRWKSGEDYILMYLVQINNEELEKNRLCYQIGTEECKASRIAKSARLECRKPEAPAAWAPQTYYGNDTMTCAPTTTMLPRTT